MNYSLYILYMTAEHTASILELWKHGWYICDRCDTYIFYLKIFGKNYFHPQQSAILKGKKMIKKKPTQTKKEEVS